MPNRWPSRLGGFEARDFLIEFQGCLRRNANANHLSLFAHKSQIPLAFVSRESNGRDAFTGSPSTRGSPPIG